MTKPTTTLPMVASLPFAHLTMRIYRVPGGGMSFGMAAQSSPSCVEVCGFVDQVTSRELRAIADAIDGADA